MRHLFAIPILLLAASIASAAGVLSLDAPLQNALEHRLLADAADGRLDDFSPLESALIASGVENGDSLLRYRRKAAALYEQLSRSLDAAAPPRERSEAIFDFMHRRILRGGYELKNTDLRQALDGGRFNCVTATVLFNYLAGRSGIECRGLQMPGHAMSRLVLPDGPLDVETTCPRWFQVKDDPQRRAAAVSQTIGAKSAGDSSNAREVAPLQLAAMIYYNRGVDLLADNRYAEAVAANVKALRLDPANETARGNLLAAINNWAIELGNRGEFAKAVGLLREGMSLDANFAAFSQNFIHIHRQWAERLCRQRRYDEALDILASASNELPGTDFLARAQDEIQRCMNNAASVPVTMRENQQPVVLRAHSAE